MTTAQKTHTLRAAIYARISQDRAGGGLGVERQEEDCRALAARLGHEVIGVYVDNDISAYSGKVRPEYRRLLADIADGTVEVVLAWHSDRLHRSPLELEGWIDACERRGVATHTVQAGQVDLSTPSGRLMARTLGNFARYESEHKADRVRRKSLQKATAGEWLGGSIPVGWKAGPVGVVLDEPSARRIRAACDDLLAGASLGSIAKDWNAAGFTTPTGKAWSYTPVRQVLNRARNAGLIEFKGEVVAASDWPAIVTEETWRAVRALLTDPARRKSVTNRSRWMVAGIATCGTCGAALKSSVVTGNGGKATYYRCPTKGTGHVARLAERVDEQVLETVAAWLGRDDLLGALIDGATTEPDLDLRSEEIALRARLKDVAEMFADGQLSRSQVEAATAKINDRLGEIARSMEVTRRGSVLAPLAVSGDPAQAWRDAPLDRQRAILRELVTVTVLPRPRSGPREYDPEFTVVAPRS